MISSCLRKNLISSDLWLFRLQKGDPDSIWIDYNSDFAKQSEQGLFSLVLQRHWRWRCEDVSVPCLTLSHWRKKKLIANKVAFREGAGNAFSTAEGAADMSSPSCFIWICRCWQLASTLSASFRFMWRTIKAKRNQAGWRHVASTQQGVKWLLGKLFTVSFASSFMTARWPQNDSLFSHHSSDTKCWSYINDILLSCVHQTKEVCVCGVRAPFRYSFSLWFYFRFSQ